MRKRPTRATSNFFPMEELKMLLIYVCDLKLLVDDFHTQHPCLTLPTHDSRLTTHDSRIRDSLKLIIFIKYNYWDRNQIRCLLTQYHLFIINLRQCYEMLCCR